MANNSRFYRAKNLIEILYHLKTVKNLKIYSGGRSIKDAKNSTLLETGEEILFISNIKELAKIEKHERYIDFGPCVTLSKIENLGESNIPKFLYDAVTSIANPLVRNSLTIAGNICNSDFYYTLYAPLLASDARLEIQSDNEIKLIPMSKFTGIKQGQILTKIRFPLIDWDISTFIRLGQNNKINDVSASFTFLAKCQKDTLVDIRIAFCGKIKIRMTELENNLMGAKIPLSKKLIDYSIEMAAKTFDNEIAIANKRANEDIEKMIHHPMQKEQFLNLLQKNLEKLS